MWKKYQMLTQGSYSMTYDQLVDYSSKVTNLFLSWSTSRGGETPYNMQDYKDYKRWMGEASNSF